MAYAYGFENWNNKGYSTKELDSETGNNYYGSRFYDPQNGIWNKQDSYRGDLTNPSSRNRYMFVEDNPVNYVDGYGYRILEIFSVRAKILGLKLS